MIGYSRVCVAARSAEASLQRDLIPEEWILSIVTNDIARTKSTLNAASGVRSRWILPLNDAPSSSDQPTDAQSTLRSAKLGLTTLIAAVTAIQPRNESVTAIGNQRRHKP